MDEILRKIHGYFPSLPQNAILKIYKARAERLRALMINGLPDDMRWLIEAKVRVAGELSDPFSFMPGFGRSSFAKRRRASGLNVCYKCARTTCDTRCRSIGLVSENRENKIDFIRDGMSKECVDNLSAALETHRSGHVQRMTRFLHTEYLKEQQRYSLGNLTLKDPVCQFIRKLDRK